MQRKSGRKKKKKIKNQFKNIVETNYINNHLKCECYKFANEKTETITVD